MKKHEKWKPGVVLGALGRALGGIWAPRRPKAQKRVDFDLPPAPQRDPFGSLFGTFSSLGPSWDLKMVVFGGGPF